VNCARVRPHLGDHMEGDLELRLRGQVDEHLRQCASCATELGELRSTVALLRSLSSPEPPAELASEVMRRIRAGEARPRRSQTVVRYVFDPRVVAALAAGLAGFAILTSIETRWVPAPETNAVRPSETVVARQAPIAIRQGPPANFATARSIQPRLAASERAAANRFYLPDPRSMVVDVYGHVDPDLQQLDLDGQLNHAKLDPNGFLRQVNEFSELERRAWIAPLVVRAGLRGDAQVVASRLRDTSHPLADRLAAEFDRMSSNPMLSVPNGNRMNAVGNPMVVPASY